MNVRQNTSRIKDKNLKRKTNETGNSSSADQPQSETFPRVDR